MYDFTRHAKKVTIPADFFNDLFMYVYMELKDEKRLRNIKEGFEQYVDNQVTRELYSKSKTAPTEEEREKARIEYLDKKGIHKDFRW